MKLCIVLPISNVYYDMPVKITVFMAAYNAANFISESIQSVLDQSFAEFELLIVNDGSIDNTADVIAQFNDPRIRVIHNDSNRGLVYTRNVALSEAKGEYIAILDSDDVAINNRLELQYNFFLKNPALALCGGHGILIDEHNNQIETNLLTMPIGQIKIKATLLFLNTYINSTVMFRTSVFKELEGYRVAPAEDYELFTRIADRYPVDNLDTVLVKYRHHKKNTSILQSDNLHGKVREIKQNQLRRLKIPADEHLTDTLFSFTTWGFKSYKFADYLDLFTQLKIANRSLEKYPIFDFEKILFDYWFQIIYEKKPKMNALALLFNRNLFKWKYVTFKQIRKAFKFSMFGIGSISK